MEFCCISYQGYRKWLLQVMTHWISFIDACCTVSVFRDHAHPSSVARTRPDATICKNGAVVIKHEAKAFVTDFDEAENELTEKLFPEAVRLFPIGTQEIIGITSCATEMKIYRVYYDRVSNTFGTDILRSYSMNSMDGRIAFIVDIAKLCRWIVGVAGPNLKFHLVMNVRTETSNKHHVTWCKDGILKEFKKHNKRSRTGGNVSEISIQYIHKIHALKLLNIEWGEPVGLTNAVLITRVGRRVADALRHGTTAEAIYQGVVAGVEQLHNAGFAHCDISRNNVFVDDKGVFLNDLEYLTPIDDPPPHLTRLPEGTNSADVKRAKELDKEQLKSLLLELKRLR